jgi:hypothetical protein
VSQNLQETLQRMFRNKKKHQETKNKNISGSKKAGNQDKQESQSKLKN